jgi:CheY-like chemotaxis protein
MSLAYDMLAGQSSTPRHIKDYYPYSILHKITSSSFHHSYTSTTNANNHHQSYVQDQKPDTATIKERETKDPFLTRILIVDDEPDVTLTFKVGLEVYYYYHDDERRRRFEVYSYNDPEVALSKFKPNFYDLLLTDIYMPRMNGFELSQRVVEIDANIRVCFMSSAEVNIEALREVYPEISFGCFIQKPVEIEYLVKRLLAELD